MSQGQTPVRVPRILVDIRGQQSTGLVGLVRIQVQLGQGQRVGDVVRLHIHELLHHRHGPIRLFGLGVQARQCKTQADVIGIFSDPLQQGFLSTVLVFS